jgi:hypothetical protein
LTENQAPMNSESEDTTHLLMTSDADSDHERDNQSSILQNALLSASNLTTVADSQK